MEVRDAFGKALRMVRLRKSLTQEDFSIVSSRTFVSMLERGATVPTLDKLECLCSVLETHPVTLLAMTYLIKTGSLEDGDALVSQVGKELRVLLEGSNAP